MTELAGLVLALSVALLVAPRPAVAAVLVAAQGAALAVAAAADGFYPDAAVLVSLNALALPWLLSGLAGPSPRPRLSVIASLCAAGLLALLAAPLSPPLAVVLLGILLAWASRDRVIAVIGLLAMQNGIALAGLSLTQPERLAAVVPAIPALACAALWLTRGRAA